MRTRKWFALLASTTVLGAGVLGGAAFVSASDDKKPAAGAPDEAAMMEMWQKAITPGPHHKTLEMMAGKFTSVTRWKMDPSQDWQTSEGAYEARMILGGRFLESTHTGTMMGMPFEGRGLAGYDNRTQRHVSTWADNFGTGVLSSTGTCDETGKRLTFEGEMPDPMVADKTVAYKYVIHVKNEDEFTFSWYMPDPAGGEMWESMNITYTRVK